MINLISIELFNSKTVVIQNPTEEELLSIEFWMNGKSNNQFYIVNKKDKKEYINRDFVVRVIKYRK